MHKILPSALYILHLTHDAIRWYTIDEEVYTVAFKDKARDVAYKNDFARQTYDRLSINPKKEEGQRIREHAAAAGDSVQGYILDAVRERMDREDQEKE